MSLAPGVAALAGYVVLGQELGVVEAVAVALVVIASTGAVRASADPSRRSGERGTGQER